ncbi:MAG TPA: hypothetical protein V6D20_08145, partial [Candidatus Obscuribacterales bacterium]
AIREEALEKVASGFVKLVKWKDLRSQIQAGTAPPVKISPIAAIPHKSCQFRLILDLSKKGQHRKGQLPTTSVNELTNPNTAPMKSMDNLGKVLPRVIQAMATQPLADGPILMSKLDIKDGFWRMCVPEEDELQFCYVLPSLHPTEEIQLVVPAALQMGWTLSPPFFSAATETGADVASLLHQQPSLPPHPLEHHMLEPINPSLLCSPSLPPHPLEQLMSKPVTPSLLCGPSLPPHPPEQHMLKPITPSLLCSFPFPQPHPDMSISQLEVYRDQLFLLFDDYVDDFINLLQSTNLEDLRHASRAILHAIHQIFPPTIATGHSGEDPISYKKLVLEGEGIWDVRKEILGWVFDGAARTMWLPEPKVAKLFDDITSILRLKHAETKAFHSLLGKLAHAMMGTAGGTALLPPLYKAVNAALGQSRTTIQIHPNSSQAHALQDLRTLLRVLGKRPTLCQQLVPGMPHYLGFCDACKYGAGGVWMSGTATLRPLVWRLAWPPAIVTLFDNGTLTINDLEMAALLLGYIILQSLLDLHLKHTAQWCDNSSTVSWTSKLSSTNSVVGQQLTRALALIYTAAQCSPLAPLPISGEHNKMADLSSRSFKKTRAVGTYTLDDHAFLTKFNTDFPLTQESSWLLLRPSTKLSSLVFGTLQGVHVRPGSWLRLPKRACDIGSIGSTSATSLEWTPSSPTSVDQHNLTTSACSLRGLEKGMQEEDIKSGLAQFRKRFAPSAKLWNWLGTPTPPTSQGLMENSSTPSTSN